jgi:hypothetical protein
MVDGNCRGLVSTGRNTEPGLFERAIDLSKLPLLDNTVTKIALSFTEQSKNSLMMVNGSYCKKL